MDLGVFVEARVQFLQGNHIHRTLLARDENRAAANLSHFEADKIHDRIVVGLATPLFRGSVFCLLVGKSPETDLDQNLPNWTALP